MPQRKTVSAACSLEVLGIRSLSEEKKRMFLTHTYFKQCESPLFEYGAMIVLRKNSVKLHELVKRSKNKDIARDYIVWLKYLISKCDSDFVKVLVALAVDYENITQRDVRYSIKNSGHEFYHTSTQFRFGICEELYGKVVGGFYAKLINSEPYMMENLEIQGYKYHATESELYLICGVMIAQAKIKTNDAQLRDDLRRRTAIDNVMKKYAELEVKTDAEWSKKDGTI